MDLDLLIISQEGVTWHDWCALADACERSGVPTLFAGDHYISTNDELGKVAHDAWTVVTGWRHARRLCVLAPWSLR